MIIPIQDVVGVKVRTIFTPYNFKLLLTSFIPLIIAGIFTLLVFPIGFSSEMQYSPEIINGLLAISGVLFALQPVIFRTRKVWFYRYILMAIFLLETAIIANACLTMLTEIVRSETELLSNSTLQVTTFSLFTSVFY
jgi:hypothetical protein